MPGKTEAWRSGLGDGAAALDRLDDVGHRLLDDVVAGGLGRDVEGGQERDARGDERREGPRPARQGDLLDDVADLHRNAQAEGVPLGTAPVAAAELAEGPGAADRGRDEGPPLALDGVGERDGELGDGRQVAAELLEDADEDRHEEGDEADEDDQREGHDDPRVDHGRLDLPAQRVLLLELVGDAQQRLLEHAAGLAGASHGHEEGREDLGVALERAAEREPGFDVLADVGDDVGQQLVLGLRLERVERAQDRHARADHRRELTREDGQVGGLDPLHEVEGDLLRPVLGLDVEDDQPARLQLVGDDLLGVRLHLAGGFRPGEVHRPEDVAGHAIRPPARRRSPAGGAAPRASRSATRPGAG
jgi:hypothetical protein